MIPYVQFGTLVWLTWALIIALRRIIAGDRSTILLVYLVFYAFFALPLLFDLVLGSSSYLAEPGFVYAERDDAVNVIYCLFIALVPLIWSGFLRAHSSRHFQPKEALRKLRRLRLPLVLLLFMPIALVWWAPDPALYLKYAFVVTENLGRR